MKKKFVWLVLSSFLAAALLMASCASPTPAPTPTPIPTPTPTPTPTPIPSQPTPGNEMVKVSLTKLDGTVVEKSLEKPKYGGVYSGLIPMAPQGFDDVLYHPRLTPGSQLSNEDLLIGDWKRGPTGTGEFPFRYSGHYKDKDRTGALLETWEFPDKDTIILHVRPGIRFALDTKSEASRLVNGRELTAQDIAWNINRGFTTPTCFGAYQSGPGWYVSATATDKYTVVLKGKDSEITRTASIYERMFEALQMVPPEVVQKYGNMNDWKTVVGTGPFILVDHVPSSSFTLVRNPNYWMKDPFFPQNQLPYLDGVKWVIVLDKSTQQAALRTGKVDHLDELTKEEADLIMGANPRLQFVKSFGGLNLGNGKMLNMRLDKTELPFKDIKVRHALQMAIDYPTIVKELYKGDAVAAWWPAPPLFPKAYTPLEELPASTKELFSYKPDKAKQLLTEAGYPKGFTTEIVTTVADVDILSIVKDYWSKIGVDLKIDVRESTVYTSLGRGFTYKEMYLGFKSLAAGALPSHRSADPGNYSRINDRRFDELYEKMFAFETITNIDLRYKYLKEAGLLGLEMAYEILLPQPYLYDVWWPWLKNFHGEQQLQWRHIDDFTRWIWYDQDLKKSMGY